MAPKKQATQPSPAAVPPSEAKPNQAVTSAAGKPTKPQNKPATSSSSASSVRNAQDAQEIVLGVWNNYVDNTPQRVKLLDAFMAFLIVVGVLQFVYCVIAGNYVSSLGRSAIKLDADTGPLAFQCLPCRLLSYSRSIRTHSELAYPDEPGE